MITFNITTQSVVDGVDHCVRELDRKWGIGRLRLFVDDTLRARFDQQRQLFNAALVNGDEEQVLCTVPLCAVAGCPRRRRD